MWLLWWWLNAFRYCYTDEANGLFAVPPQSVIEGVDVIVATCTCMSEL